MSRLPPRPKIEFRSDGTPVAEQHDDVYFSAHDGLAETRAVFLQGCGLPEAWSGREHFCVAELGFGTGLNFLALWELWQRTRPSPTTRLDFVSFEGYPMDAAQAGRALSRWPELSGFSARLLGAWPERYRGIAVRDWPEDGIRLTLHQGDITEEFPKSHFAADAWFLDGFSPAKNPDMWSDEVLQCVGARSQSGARAGTFTVAGSVRRGLTNAGFDVEKVPGFGRKRERLEARYSMPIVRSSDLYGLRSPTKRPRRIAVIGAGIAGACVAHAARTAGLEPVVFDREPRPASEASGNVLALVHPRLDAADTAPARIHLQAGFVAERLYRQFPEAAISTGVIQRPKDSQEAERHEKLLADPPIEALQAEGDGLTSSLGMVLRPQRLIPALLNGVEQRLGAAAKVEGLTVNGESFDAVIFANAMAAAELGFPLTAKQGQVESFDQGGMPMALTRSNYVIGDGETVVFGATFEAGLDLEISDDALNENLTRLSELSPDVFADASEAVLTSRTGVRATSPDRLPLAGARPDLSLATDFLAPLGKGQTVEGELPVVNGQYVLTGLGSRGFTLAPLMADLIISQVLGRSRPLSRPEAEALSPARFLIRDIKRGKL